MIKMGQLQSENINQMITIGKKSLTDITNLINRYLGLGEPGST